MPRIQVVVTTIGHFYLSEWTSGAVADDGCLYCFPIRHTRILKFNPSNDTVSFVGEMLGPSHKFNGTVKAKDGV